MAKGKKRDRGENTAVEGRPGNQSGDVEAGKQQNKREIQFQLDPWQEEVIECQDNIALRAGRQVGKSTAIAVKASNYATSNPKQSIMIISATERQAFLLFSKVLGYLFDNYKSWIKGMQIDEEGRTIDWQDRPTKSEIKLTNGSIIRCLPTGLDGLGIRGYTVNLLIADEAAFIPEAVWAAVTPMLSTTGGKIILLSTPKGSSGYFFDCYHNDQFKTWHINAEDIAETRKDPQKTWMKEYYRAEKDRLTKNQYAQEYLAAWISDFHRIYPDNVIKGCAILGKGSPGRYKDTFLGVDVARMGDDFSAFSVIGRKEDGMLHQIDHIMTQKTLTTDTFDRIMQLNRRYNFKGIGIDMGSGSLGVGLGDFLFREPTIRRKIVALDNKKIMKDYWEESKSKLLNEHMYFGLLALMEKRKILLLNDDDVIHSLRSIQYEYLSEEGKTRMKIFASHHRDTDSTEALMRAAWLANQKQLNTFIDWI